MATRRSTRFFGNLPFLVNLYFLRLQSTIFRISALLRLHIYICGVMAISLLAWNKEKKQKFRIGNRNISRTCSSREMKEIKLKSSFKLYMMCVKKPHSES